MTSFIGGHLAALTFIAVSTSAMTLAVASITTWINLDHH